MTWHLSIAELARVIHPRGSKHRVMALLKAYFDASFTEPSGITAIGGYVGSEQEWKRVEERWLENLDLWGLEEFHLAPLLAGATHLGRANGELCALSFARIIHKSDLHGIGASLRDEDWESAPKNDAFIARMPNKYHSCLDMVLAILDQHMSLELPGELVAIIADSDTTDEAASKALFERRKALTEGRFVSFTFSSKARFPVLQCADLYAGEERKAWLKAKAWAHPEMGQLYNLAQGRRASGTHWSAEVQRKIGELIEERKRRPREEGD
jgi:hypothetical protein